MKNYWNIQVLILVTIGAVVTPAPPQNCVFSRTNEITNKKGEITEDALYSQNNCNYTWEFTEIPNSNFMLVLNITEPPLYLDVIKLFGEDFIEGDEDKYCRIFEFQNRDFRKEIDRAQAEEIHKKFPGCKLRSGVNPPVRLAYYGRPHFWSKPEFTIQYEAIPVNIGSPSTTREELPSTTGVPSSTTFSEKSQSAPTLTIILGVLGGVILILALFLAAALLMRRKKLTHSVNKEPCQAVDFYQSIPSNSSSSRENSADPVYYNEQAGGEFGVNLSQQNGKNVARKTPKTEQNCEAENVQNPLYVSQDGVVNHSYEYIDIRIPVRREDRR